MVAENSGYIDRDILKQALFLSTTEWDSYLDLLIAAAVNVVNDYTGHDFSAHSRPGVKVLRQPRVNDAGN